MSNPYGDVPLENTVVLDWLSDDAAGSLSADICSTFAAAQKAIHKNNPQPSKLKGYIVGFETIPGEDGDLTTDLPTDQYDIELHSPYDVDVLGGTAKNRSGTVGERVGPSVLIPVDSEITVEISNAGNAKQGRIILYLSPNVV